MILMRGSLLLFLLLFASLTPGSVIAAPDGYKLYIKHCSVCHNDKGIGGIGLPLNGEKVKLYSYEYLFKTIRLGRKGRIMPAFTRLSDSQINAIVNYIFSWKEIKQKPFYDQANIAGNPNKGGELYQKLCASCHGKDGKSNGLGTGVTSSREREFQVVPPALNNVGFLASASDEWIKKTIQQGRPGTIMPSQSTFNINDQDLNDIVSYIRSYELSVIPEKKEIDNQPTLVFESPYDFITTISNIKQSLKGLNFRYFPDRYMEMGLAPDETINKKQLSLRFCNFQQLYKMINVEPRLGVVLPCRVTVVEGPDGNVKIYVMNMKLVSRLFNNSQLNDIAEDMHNALIELIDEATL